MKDRKGLSVLLLICILSCTAVLALLSASADNQKLPEQIWVEPSGSNGISARISLIKPETGSGDESQDPADTVVYCLFLPGSADPEECFLSWDGGMQAEAGGAVYDSGECPVPPVSTGKTYIFKNQNTTRMVTVEVFQGSAKVHPVFIEIDEGNGNPSIGQMKGDADHKTACTGRINIAGQWYEMPKIKGRGNATWTLGGDKRPYNITLKNKICFPGVDSAAARTWSFLAEGFDCSLLRNRAGFFLAREMGIGQDTVSADVWMNGEYQGCYTVTPKTDSFVPWNGFMIEEDNYIEPAVEDGGDPQFQLDGLYGPVTVPAGFNLITVKKMGDGLLMKDGAVDESPDHLRAAAAGIRDWLQEAWDAVRSDDGFNPATGKYYTDYIDIESFARMYLVQEYVKSFDICSGSILFYRNGQTDADKLTAGPLWDMDAALGATIRNELLGRADDAEHGDRRSGEGDFIANIEENKTSVFKTLGRHEDFMREVEYQYSINQQAFDHLDEEVAQMVNDIEASALMNYTRNRRDIRVQNAHKYRTATELGSGQYRQVYLATREWADYVRNLRTFIVTRSLWFRNKYG